MSLNSYLLEQVLLSFKNNLHGDTISTIEQKACIFYIKQLVLLKKKNSLNNCSHFYKGIGGTGDNIICLDIVERDKNKLPLLNKDKTLKITPCVFENIDAYLDFIQNKKIPIRDIAKISRKNFNGVTRDLYIEYWSLILQKERFSYLSSS